MSINLVYQLSMPNCSSCGRHIGHLYDDYRELAKQLTEDLENNEDAVPSQDYVGRISDVDVTDFIRTYYEWKRENPKAPTFRPINIVARALLAHKELEKGDLPFGTRRELDGQRYVFDTPICCLRMFMCDPQSNL